MAPGCSPENDERVRETFIHSPKKPTVRASRELVTGSRVFSLTCPLGSLGPELMANLFQRNTRSEQFFKLKKNVINENALDIINFIDIIPDPYEMPQTAGCVNSYCQELTIDVLVEMHWRTRLVEQNIEDLESLNSVNLEDRKRRKDDWEFDKKKKASV
ncbi:hypothetical protein TNCV_2797531 [Trichonephila clavipes]|nr:hypothetical protein TNCV_2797531 [Trichonephila clavipes]